MYGLSPAIATNVQEVMSDVQGFIVATPNDTHYAIAREILSEGKPLLIEKPLTTSYDHAVELCKLAEQRATFIAVGYRYRFFPTVRLLKELLENGYFGRILAFHCEMGSRGGWEPVSGYSLERSRSGGGVLVINGTHFLDLALYWFGDPSSFRYQDDNYGNVEANCKGTLTFDNDNGSFDGSFFFSKTMKLSNRYLIDTETHIIEWSPLMAETIAVFDKKRPDLRMELSSTNPRGSPVDYFQVQLEEFCENIRELGTVTSDGWSAAKSIKLIEKMYENSSHIDEDWLTYKTQHA
jgi:predicted dehydrogenase